MDPRGIRGRVGIFRGRRRLMAVALAIGLLALVTGDRRAGAESPGQLSVWGGFGSGPGQFFNPSMLGVDGSDGSVFTGDVTPDLAHYRIQKLSPAGAFEASVEIPRKLALPGGKTGIAALHGIAVDPDLGRIYVIEGCKVSGTSECKEFDAKEKYSARRILSYSIEPDGDELVPAPTHPVIALPDEGEDALYNPQAIAVDPSDGDLVVLAETADGHKALQRVSPSGVAGARFVDTTNLLKAGGAARSIAVGPDGTVYTLTGGKAPGAANTRAWELPSDLSSLREVPGFAAAAEIEGWRSGLLDESSQQYVGGPQIAISPDGQTLYWKEGPAQLGEADPGEVLVRGYSLTEGATRLVYGGAPDEEGRGICAIGTSSAGLAAVGNTLVVFDYGPQITTVEEPSYGDRVLTFGPGGSGCPEPVAKFSINDEDEEGVIVNKDEVITFDASASELLEGFRGELIWKFGDGSEERVKSLPETETEPAEEALPTVTHQYTTAGDFTVQLEIKLSDAPFGSPPPVEHTLKVEGPSEPKFKLTVSEAGSGTVTSSPSGIACGPTCEAEYEEGTVVTLIPIADGGSEFEGWSGACTGTGACEVTMRAAKSVSAEFAPALKPKFKLTVSEAGSGTVTSSPSGLACGSVCEAEYEEGISVALVAAPAEDSEFEGWSGACTGTGACDVTISAAKSVSAEFVSAPKLRFKLTVLKFGPGIVTSSPSGVSCGAICERGYEKGEVVTLIPIPAVASKFEGWGGACAEIGACEVTMSAAREVTATFDSVFSVPSIESPPQGGGDPQAPGGAPPPSPRPKPKVSPLAKCKNLKGRKKAKCVKHAHKGGR